MSAAVTVADVQACVERIRPLLAGLDPGVQGAILADLLATWLAGHEFKGDAAVTRVLRRDLLASHIEHVRKLVPLNARAIGTVS